MVMGGSPRPFINFSIEEHIVVSVGPYAFIKTRFFPQRAIVSFVQASPPETTTLKSFNQYNPHLEDQYDYPRLFLLLHQNSQFRQLKYQYLHQLISDYSQLQTEFQDIYQKYGSVYLYDTTDEVSTRHKKKMFQSCLLLTI